jgi:hypothetical protein
VTTTGGRDERSVAERPARRRVLSVECRARRVSEFNVDEKTPRWPTFRVGGSLRSVAIQEERNVTLPLAHSTVSLVS